MSHRFLASLLFAFAGLGVAFGRASAADLDPGYAQIPPLEQERVEFGTGWYIRGDLGVTRGLGVKASDEPYSGIYTGPGQAPPGLGTSNSNALNYTGSLGGGYQFTNKFRADAVVDFHQPIQSSTQGVGRGCITGTAGVGPTPYQAEVAYTTTCTPTLKATLKSYDALVNGYFDLGTWASVTPYVGAGIGISFGHAQASSQYYQGNNAAYQISYIDAINSATYSQNWDRSQSKQYYNLAFALMAGISYDIYDHTKLDIGYRYLHLGQILGSNVTTQEVRAGLRYMIDN